MQVWPAIDLRGGKCVRLRQGDYQRETIFGDDPVAVARQWVDQGAECLHLVDLDGARDGTPANVSSIERIVAAVDVPCQVGGGIRDDGAIRQYLEIGVRRVIVGTRAVREPEWLEEICRRFAGHVVLGIDARQGRVATAGWLETESIDALEFARRLDHLPLAGLVYTDIARDGMLEGPNVAAMRSMKQAVPFPVIASGGISSAQDVRELAEAGMDGCIIGRALYEGALELPDALQAARTARNRG